MKKNVVFVISTVFIAIGVMLSSCTAPTNAPTTVSTTAPAAPTITSAAPAAGNGTPTVAFSADDTSSAFITSLVNGVKDKFVADGVDMQISSAGMDSAVQMSQVENYATMKTTVVILLPADPQSIKDTVARARASGTKFLALNTTDKGVYDSIMYTDRFAVGKAVAELAAKWVNETFPDAANESVEVGIFEDRTNPVLSLTADGLHEITKLCSKCKVVSTIGGVRSNQQAQDAMGALFLTNPDVKVILTGGGESALGVNAWAMRGDSGLKDRSKFGVFAGDWSPEIAKAIQDSMQDASVYRGTVKFGAPDLVDSIYQTAKKMAFGQDFPAEIVDPYVGIDKSNIAEFITQ